MLYENLINRTTQILSHYLVGNPEFGEFSSKADVDVCLRERIREILPVSGGLSQYGRRTIYLMKACLAGEKLIPGKEFYMMHESLHGVRDFSPEAYSKGHREGFVQRHTYLALIAARKAGEKIDCEDGYLWQLAAVNLFAGIIGHKVVTDSAKNGRPSKELFEFFKQKAGTEGLESYRARMKHLQTAYDGPTNHFPNGVRQGMDYMDAVTVNIIEDICAKIFHPVIQEMPKDVRETFAQKISESYEPFLQLDLSQSGKDTLQRLSRAVQENLRTACNRSVEENRAFCAENRARWIQLEADYKVKRFERTFNGR